MKNFYMMNLIAGFFFIITFLMSINKIMVVLLFLLAILVNKFLFNFTHTLIALLTLEAMMINNMFLFFMLWVVSFFHMSFMFLFLLFTFSVMEACVGVSILVMLSREKGNEELGSIW